MKVFLSSVISGMQENREAASDAITSLGHGLIRAEDFGASPQSPQQACLQGVRDADVVVLVLGQRYGFIQQSGLSATHEEYREAKDRCDILVLIQQSVERDSEQDSFVQEAQNWNAGQYTESFSTPDELRRLVIRRLRDLELARQAGQPDETEMLVRAEELTPDRSEVYHDALSIAIAGGPRRQVLRPSELEDAALPRRIAQEAIYGSNPIFMQEEGVHTEIAGHRLRLYQEHASVVLDEEGSIRIVQTAAAKGGSTFLSALIEEEILEAIERGLRFAGWVLDQVDRPRRLSDIVPIAGLLNASYMPWRTRAEHQQSPNSATVPQTGDRVVVHLAPLSRKRAALLNDSHRLAEDLTVLLRREMKKGF